MTTRVSEPSMSDDRPAINTRSPRRIKVWAQSTPAGPQMLIGHVVMDGDEIYYRALDSPPLIYPPGA